MQTVQIAIGDNVYANRLRNALACNGTFKVLTADTPDPAREGVLVIDEQNLNYLSSKLPHPERVVLITRKDPQEIDRAWHAGITSVVYRSDPASTAILAILSVAMRVPKPAGNGQHADLLKGA
jgi:hypothetical protein